MRRILALLCLLALLFAALMPGAPGLPVAVLAPLFFFLALLVALTRTPYAFARALPSCPVISPLGSRAPPLR